MNGQLWTVIGLLITNAGFLFGMWKYFDARITRVYGRLDEVKDSVDEIYVRKDVCQVMHTQTASSLAGLESRIGERFTNLEKEVRDNFKMILNILQK